MTSVLKAAYLAVKISIELVLIDKAIEANHLLVHTKRIINNLLIQRYF